MCKRRAYRKRCFAELLCKREAMKFYHEPLRRRQVSIIMYFIPKLCRCTYVGNITMHFYTQYILHRVVQQEVAVLWSNCSHFLKMSCHFPILQKRVIENTVERLFMNWQNVYQSIKLGEGRHNTKYDNHERYKHCLWEIFNINVECIQVKRFLYCNSRGVPSIIMW